jgi:excisionase family DNA binding protein
MMNTMQPYVLENTEKLVTLDLIPLYTMRLSMASVFVGTIAQDMVSRGSGMAAIPEREFHTVKQIAELLQLNVATVRLMIREGELEAIKVRKEWRVTKEAFQRYLDTHKTGEPPGT